MESEIVKMIGNLFDLPENDGGGNLTTGGTESTILAIKAYKKYKTNNSYFSSKLEVVTNKRYLFRSRKYCKHKGECPYDKDFFAHEDLTWLND